MSIVKYFTASAGSKVAEKLRGSAASPSSTVTVNNDVDSAAFSIMLMLAGKFVISGLSLISGKENEQLCASWNQKELPVISKRLKDSHDS